MPPLVSFTSNAAPDRRAPNIAQKPLADASCSIPVLLKVLLASNDKCYSRITSAVHQQPVIHAASEGYYNTRQATKACTEPVPQCTSSNQSCHQSASPTWQWHAQVHQCMLISWVPYANITGHSVPILEDPAPEDVFAAVEAIPMPSRKSHGSNDPHAAQ